MCRADRVNGLLAVLSCIALMTTACRDAEPPAPYARDLGTDEQPLLPTGSEWRDTAVVSNVVENMLDAWYHDDARSMGIEIVPPDINRCDAEFKVENGKIYFGLTAVKNVGANAIRQAVAEREENGPFKSIINFCSRISSRLINRRGVESLIHAGAFDGMPGHRAQKIGGLERIMEIARQRGLVMPDAKQVVVVP